jgi:hypothetical protein
MQACATLISQSPSGTSPKRSNHLPEGARLFGRPLEVLQRSWLAWILSVGALIVLGMVVIVNIDVFGRWLWNSLRCLGRWRLTEIKLWPSSTFNGTYTLTSNGCLGSCFLNVLSKCTQTVSQFCRLGFNVVGALIWGS